jgi:Xaa-Pro dipeptidase
MADAYSSRVERFVAQSTTDVTALIPGTNMLYFTGLSFHLGKRPIIGFFSRRGHAFIIPLLEVNKFEESAPVQARLFAWSDADGYRQAFRDAAAYLGLDAQAILGVDGYTMRVFEWLALAEAGIAPERMTDVGHHLMMFRAIKTEDEVARMQRAVHISEKALETVLAGIKPGMTEREVAQRLADEQRALGADDVAFEAIVLAGERSALPHGNPGERTFKHGDIVLIDYGCKVGNYPSDITRTFVLGTPSDDIRRMYSAVYDANAAARAVARPGVTWGDVDKAARDVIESYGLGAHFTHRTGHGLGLDGHELPQIASGETHLLEPGMVFTIEPGVYIAGVGGVRIEDNMLVTADGCQSLTSFPRELRTL